MLFYYEIQLKALFSALLPPITGCNINPALTVHILNSLGSILARRHFRGAVMRHQATHNVSILPGIHLYTMAESSNVDKMSCWRTKVPDNDGNRTPLIQSQGSIQYTMTSPLRIWRIDKDLEFISNWFRNAITWLFCWVFYWICIEFLQKLYRKWLVLFFYLCR